MRPWIWVVDGNSPLIRQLEHVHDTGFMHMDFKPENILLQTKRLLILISPCLVLNRRQTGKERRNPGLHGSRTTFGEPVDHRADIFAYGVMAFEVLNGQNPFVGSSTDILKSREDNSKLPEPEPEIPLPLEKIILKSLECIL